MRIKVILSCSKLLRLIAWQKDGAVDKGREIRAGGSVGEKHNEFGFIHTDFGLAFELVRLALGKDSEIDRKVLGVISSEVLVRVTSIDALTLQGRDCEEKRTDGAG